ncbi:MAG TPA: DMT family transporter [Firmicutes bacterium]|nr:DMT family transporter [Bacillota bacterium]
MGTHEGKRVIAGIALSAVAMSWGMGFVATAKALEKLPPILFLGLRFSIGFCVMAALFGKRLIGITPSELKAGAFSGSILAAGFVLQTFAMEFASVATVAFLTALYVVIVPLLSAIFTGTQVEKLQAGAALVSFSGVALSSLTGLDGPIWAVLLRELWPGEVLGMGCALFFALHILAVGRWAPGIEVSRFATIQIGAVSIICLCASYLSEPWSLGMSDMPWASLLYLGVLNTAGAFLAQSWAQRYTSVTQAAVLMSSEPVWAALFGFLILGEKLSMSELAGNIMILAGMILAQDFIPRAWGRGLKSRT